MGTVTFKTMVSDWIRLKTQSGTPATPATGYGIFYDKNKTPAFKNSDGTEFILSVGSGDVVGPSSAIDGHIAVFDSTSGKLIKDGGPLQTNTPPLVSDFTWVNQASTTTNSNSDGSLFINTPQNGNQLSLLKKACPSTPYSIIIKYLPYFDYGAGYPKCGLVFRESSSGKLHSFQLTMNGSIWAITSSFWNNATNWSSHYVNTNYNYVPKYLKIADDGINRICSIGEDGYNFRPIHTINRTTDITANEIGFCVESSTSVGSSPAGMTILSWTEGG